jgi:hypothetical protein
MLQIYIFLGYGGQSAETRFAVEVRRTRDALRLDIGPRGLCQ